MTEKMYKALEVCLNALETGADIGVVLKRFPDMKDDLAPLLEASRQAKKLAITDIPEPVINRSRMRVLQHAAEMREAVARPRNRWAMFAFPRLATSLAIAFLLLISGTGLVNASSAALPGDNLYPVKRTWEDVRLLLAFDDEIREELEDEFEDERLHEVDELLMEGRHETITFAGVVTEQNGNQWMVSGITIQITLDSNLPNEPVPVGAAIMVEGHTNANGFVEAEQVDLLDAGIALPISTPVEIEVDESEEDEQEGASGLEFDTEDDQDDLKIEISYEQSESSDDDDDDSHDASSENEGDSDSSDDNNDEERIDDESGGDDNDDDHNDNDDSEGGGDDNDNESH